MGGGDLFVRPQDLYLILFNEFRLNLMLTDFY
jgi:hypothetical protein